jgi:hypothetical protein
MHLPHQHRPEVDIGKLLDIRYELIRGLAVEETPLVHFNVMRMDFDQENRGGQSSICRSQWLGKVFKTFGILGRYSKIIA